MPKNVVSLSKWWLDADGRAKRVQKWRVTTDDSIAVNSSDSRNYSMDRDDPGNVSLPRIQQLARAVEILRAVAARWGVAIPK